MKTQKNKRRSSGVGPLSDARRDRALGDKGIAVKIRSNSHYRNSRFDESSRNAYRPVTPIEVSRASGEVVCAVRQESAFSQHPEEGAFILSFCKDNDLQ